MAKSSTSWQKGCESPWKGGPNPSPENAAKRKALQEKQTQADKMFEALAKSPEKPVGILLTIIESGMLPSGDKVPAKDMFRFLELYFHYMLHKPRDPSREVAAVGPAAVNIDLSGLGRTDTQVLIDQLGGVSALEVLIDG